jgi:hypothetical protein
MKKLMMLVVAVFLAVPTFAQEPPSLSIYKTENGVFSVDMVSHLGWGFHFVKSDDFTPKGSGEFFLNVLNFKIYPVESFGLEAGLDCKWNYFGSRNDVFAFDANHLVQAMNFDFVGSNLEKTRSDFSIFALSVPVVAKFKAGSFMIGGGAEANFNLSCKTYYRFESNETRTTHDAWKGKVNQFTYDFVGMIGYQNVYLLAKFYPKSSRLLPEGSVAFNYWTLGFGFTI